MESDPPAREPSGPPPTLKGYSIDVHDLTVLVAAQAPAEVGSTVALELSGRDGLRMRAVGRVEPPIGGIDGPMMVVRLLDVRPLREQPMIAPESLRPEAPEPSGSDPIRVLVVDDDATVRKSAGAAIQAAGFEVIEAKNGAEALSKASQGDVSLILSDVNMPTMDGWQLLRLLRNREDLRHLPVMFLTSLLNERERMRGYAQGVDDYIDKPFEAQDLAERVERLLHRAASPVSHGAARTLRGDLRHVSLGSLLSFLESDGHSGVLRMSRASQRARIGLGGGLVRCVELDPDETIEGEDLSRLFMLLDWEDGEFELLTQPFEGEDELGLPTAYILLEHARRKDTLQDRK